jgi:hypothetical protein
VPLGCLIQFVSRVTKAGIQLPRLAGTGIGPSNFCASASCKDPKDRVVSVRLAPAVGPELGRHSTSPLFWRRCNPPCAPIGTNWYEEKILAFGPSAGERPGPRLIYLQPGSLHLCFRRSIQVRSGSLRCFSGAVRRLAGPCHLPFSGVRPLGHMALDCFAERECLLSNGGKRFDANGVVGSHRMTNGIDKSNQITAIW